MAIARYRKLVAALVGVVAFAGNQWWGWEPTEVLIEQIINGVIGVLLLIGVERLPNKPPFDWDVDLPSRPDPTKDWRRAL